jgi:hypothetical protein
MKNSSEFENFDQTMRKLMNVPHSEIKAKLDEEKAEKKARPKKRGRPTSCLKRWTYQAPAMPDGKGASLNC